MRSHEIRSALGDTQGDASSLNRVGAVWHKLGELEYVPFAALPLPAIGADAKGARAAVPLIARHQVVELPSASVLATLRRETAGRTRPPRTVAVLADPVFEAGDLRVAQSRALRDPNVTRGVTLSAGVEDLSYAATRAVQRIGDIRGGAGLARLPFSRDEATAIAALSRPKDTLSATDFAANRGAALGTALAAYRSSTLRPTASSILSVPSCQAWSCRWSPPEAHRGGRRRSSGLGLFFRAIGDSTSGFPISVGK